MRARFRLLAGEALRDPFRRLRSRGCSFRPALARPGERSLLRDRCSRGFASPESSDDEYSLDDDEEEEEEDEDEEGEPDEPDALGGPASCFDQFARPLLGEAHYEYDQNAWSGGKMVSASEGFFRQYRSENPRPFGMRAIEDWPKPLPYVLTEDGSGVYASIRMEDLGHARSIPAQILMMEMRGVLGWLDQQFHPLASWPCHVHQVRSLHFFRTMSECDPKITGRNYKAALCQIDVCLRACVDNEPDTFRSAMGVFCEKMFAHECQGRYFVGSLSCMFGQLLFALRDGKFASAIAAPAWTPLFGLTIYNATNYPLVVKWIAVINDLAAKADCVAVMLVDALCIGIANSTSTRLFPNIVFNEHVSGCTLRASTTPHFTDQTAPLYYQQYWMRHSTSTVLALEAASRTECSDTVRCRFADTAYTAKLHSICKMYGLFLETFKVDAGNPAGVLCAGHKDYRAELLPAGAVDTFCPMENAVAANTASCVSLESNPDWPGTKLKVSIEACHFGGWGHRHKLFAACSLMKFACERRARLVDTMVAALKLPSPPPMNAQMTLANGEIYANLDQAYQLIDLVMSTGVYIKKAYTLHSEVRCLSSSFKEADERFHKQVQYAARENRKRANRQRAEAEEARKRLVHVAAQAAIGNVLRCARERDAEARLQEQERDDAELVAIGNELAKERAALDRRASALAAENAARESAHQIALARTVKLNQEAAVRREQALAARAQIEKEAAVREAKEDAEREKRREQEARDARKVQRKAEVLAQRERVQAEVDAAAEERTRRRAKEKADAAAEARLTMAAEKVKTLGAQLGRAYSGQRSKVKGGDIGDFGGG